MRASFFGPGTPSLGDLRGRRSHHRVGTLCALLGFSLAASCGTEEKKAGLVVAVQTDMSVPKDVDAVEIEVTAYGREIFKQRYDVGTDGGIYIPATITLLPPKQTGTPVTLRVISFQNGTARTLRRVVTTVPDTREALLRMPISWLCDGQVKADGEDHASTCKQEGSSCLAGACVTDEVDSSTLNDFVVGNVFGGGKQDGGGSTCFDTERCFANNSKAADFGLDTSTCSLSIRQALEAGLGGTDQDAFDADKLNFALASSEGEGICGDWGCFVPLERDELTGWSVDGDTVRLPSIVCSDQMNGAALVVSTACPARAAATPPCGEWTGIDGSKITVPLEDLPPPLTGSGGSDGTGGTNATGGMPSTGGSGGDASGGSGGSGGDGTGGGRTGNRCVPGEYWSGGTELDRECTPCASGSFSTTDNAAVCATWTDCVPGEFVTNAPSPTENRTCTSCANGTTTTGMNQSLCQPIGACQAGTIQTVPATGGNPPVCEPCAPGTYCPGGESPAEPCAADDWDHDADPATACVSRTSCAAGTFVSNVGDETQDRQCAGCTSGSFSTIENAPSCTAWVDCFAGTYVTNVPSPTADRLCASCAAGTFTSGINESQCLPQDVCPAGTVELVPAIGATPPVCDPCLAGTYCAGDTAPAVPCPADTWDNDGNPATQCVAMTVCAAGESVVADGTSTEDRLCAPCAEGTFSDTVNAGTCTAWLDCTAGEFVLLPGSPSADRTCAECPDGTFSETMNAASCMAWLDCQPGSYVSGQPSTTLDRSCSACMPGEYTALLNESACHPQVICEPGTVQTQPGSESAETVCTPCAPGTFCAGSDLPAQPCGDDTFDGDSNPATNCEPMTPCMAGDYVSFPGSSTENRTCSNCLSGSFTTGLNETACTPWLDCFPGTNVVNVPSSTMDRVCAECPQGTFTSGVNESICLLHDMCPAGTWQSAPGTPESQPVCDPCPAGTYCPGGTTPVFACSLESWDDDANPATACVSKTHCGQGELVTDPGSTTADRQCGPCPTEHYTMDEDATACTPWTVCTSGSYVLSNGTEASDRLCAPCENGFSVTNNALACTPFTMCLPGYVEDLPGTPTSDRTCKPGATFWQFGTSLQDRAVASAVDGSDNWLVVGRTMGALPGQTSLGNMDGFLVRLSNAGSATLTLQFGSSASDYAEAVAVDANGDVYVAGYTNGALPGQTNSGDNDVFVRKYSSAGTELWTRQFGTTASDRASSIAVDSSGDVIVAGATEGALPGQTSGGGSDVFVRKYSSAGTEAWTHQFGVSGTDFAYSVSADPNGSVLVAGYLQGSLPGQTSAGGPDAFIRKYDAAGNEIFTRQFGSSNDDRAYAVSADSAGNVLVAGIAGGALPGQTSLGSQDAYVSKYSASGTLLWVHQFGSGTYDLGHAVTVDGDDQVIVAGYTDGTLPGAMSSGNYDAFFRKLDSAGNVLETRQLGSGDIDLANAVSVDSLGSVLLVGETLGALPTQVALGDLDACVIRVDP